VLRHSIHTLVHSMEAEKASLAGEQSTPKDEVPIAEPKLKSAGHVGDADDAADPDEDDLDDLDDMLEEFSSVKLNSKTTVPKPAAAATVLSAVSPSPTPPAGETSQAGASVPESDEFSEEEFQKQLQAGMAELMGDLDGSVSLILSIYRCVSYTNVSAARPPSPI
jgi:peroxin-19